MHHQKMYTAGLFVFSSLMDSGAVTGILGALASLFVICSTALTIWESKTMKKLTGRDEKDS